MRALLPRLFAFAVLPFLAAAAFAADTDGDGLTDDFETALGSDPNDSDTDDDGWSDFVEATEKGTDVTLADMDGDLTNDPTDSNPFDPGSGLLDGGSTITKTGAPTSAGYAAAGTSPMAGRGAVLTSGAVRRSYGFGAAPGRRPSLLGQMDCCGDAPAPEAVSLLDFELRLEYSSQSAFDGRVGKGWFAPLLDTAYTVDGSGNFTVLREDGVQVTYTNSSGIFTSPAGMRDELTLSAGVYTRTTPEGMSWTYSGGLLDEVSDRFGNSIALSHGSGGETTSVTDTRGNSHTFSYYSGTGRLSTMTVQGGAGWSFTYNTKGQLLGVTGPATTLFPAGITREFRYVNGSSSSALNGNLLIEIDGRGNSALRYAYDSSDRVTKQYIDSWSNYVAFDYSDVANRKVTVTDRAGNEKVYEWAATTLAIASLVEKTNRGVRSGEGDYTTTWGSNTAGYITSVTLPRGNGAKWTLNSAQLPTEERRKEVMSAADGSGDIVHTWTLDSAKYYAPSSYTDPRGNTTSFTLNSKGQPTTITFPTLTHVTPNQTVTHGYTYNTDGTVASFTDGEGKVTSWSYYSTGTKTGLLESVVRDDGGLDLTTTWDYTSWGGPASVTDPRGNTTTLTAERYGNVTEIAAPSALGYVTKFEYTANLGVTKVSRKNIDYDGTWLTTPAWWETSYARHPNNKVASMQEMVTASASRSTSFSFDANDNVIAQERGPVRTEWTYDERDLVYTQVRDPGTGHIQATDTFHYDGNRNLTSHVNPRSKTATKTWDLFDRMTAAVTPIGHYRTTDYDKAGNVTDAKAYAEAGATDLLLEHTKHTYDAMNRRWKEEGLLQGTTDQWLARTFTLDKRGLMTAHSDRRGYDTLHEWDGAGRLVEEEDAAGNIRAYTLDANGNVTALSETEKLHGSSTTETYVTEFEHDALNRLKKRSVVDRTNSSNKLVTEYKLDALGFLRRTIDPRGYATTRSRDGLGRVTEESREVSASGSMVTGTAWDDHDNVLSLTDDNGNETLYEYDLLHRLVEKTYEDSNTVALAWDANGNLTLLTDQNGTEIDLVYDDNDRLVSRDYTLASGVGGITEETYQWDGLGRMTSAVNDHSTVQYTYDSLSRVLTEVQGANPLGSTGKTVTNEWDAEGNLTKITYPSGFVVNREYAEISMLTGLEDGSSVSIATFEHWGHHRSKKTTFGSGATANRSYDGYRRPTEIFHKTSGGTEFAGFDYGYDANGNPTYEARSHESGYGDVYTYDRADRLVKALTAVDDPAAEAASPGSRSYSDKLEYNMDDVHNLTSYVKTPYGGSAATTSYTTSSMNLYTVAGGVTHVYDDNGNLKDDGSKLYKYDGLNRLIEVKDKGTSAVLMTAKFDAAPSASLRGRRFEKTTGSVTTRTIHSGEDPIEDYEGGSLARKWVYDDGIDRPVMMEAPDVADVDQDSDTSELKRFYYHGQLIGSVTHVTDSSQNVVESYSYDPWGKVTIKDRTGATVSSTQVGNPWMFTGRQWDKEAGLYHYRARAYSPELRRFVQRDPLEYVDGMNAGSYARGSPTRELDPLGLDTAAAHRKKAEELRKEADQADADADAIALALKDQGLEKHACKWLATEVVAEGGLGTVTKRLAKLCNTTPEEIYSKGVAAFYSGFMGGIMSCCGGIPTSLALKAATTGIKIKKTVDEVGERPGAGIWVQELLRLRLLAKDKRRQADEEEKRANEAQEREDKEKEKEKANPPK
ncbi:MAG: hypothetical protein HMLKMBBP_02132 [Planctomycetes bacterium]|nr:hypothetical protein [Planctomycetota bacterium]